MIGVNSKIEDDKEELSKIGRKKWIRLWFQVDLLAWLFCNIAIIIVNSATKK